MKKVFYFLLIILFISLGACRQVPNGVTVVSDFQLKKYLGTWYEIARLENSFEKDLDSITANYSLMDDGGVKVLNRGYNTKKAEWENAEGKAYFVAEPSTAMLKVSFFGPFYAGYNVIALDQENYQYAMVSGPDRSYLWILSRTKSLNKDTLDGLISQAKELGYATDELIFVEHKN